MDHVYLTGPQGTMIDVGSWIRTDPGPDYGARDVLLQAYAENALVDGGRLAYEHAPVRRMTFPLMVPSGGIAGQSLDQIESLLHFCARPGGYIDIQPDGTPTANMTRFDLLGGRVNHDPYSIPVQRAARRQLSLDLDVQPFGYWPTWITLASVPSAPALPGVAQPILAASIIGDAPAFVRLAMRSNNPTVVASSSAQCDGLAWSLGAPGVPTFFGASLFWNLFSYYPNASWVADSSASYLGGAVLRASSCAPGALVPAISTAVNADFAGRHHVFGFFRMAGGNANTLRAMVDVVANTNVAAATAAQIATIMPVASYAAGSFWGGSFFSIIDLGEVSLPNPAQGSANPSWTNFFRVWVGGASDGAAATTTLDFAGLSIIPADGPVGIMPRGLVQPTISGLIDQYGMIFDSAARVAGLSNVTSTSLDVGQKTTFVDAWIQYRGGLPYLGASDVTLRILPFERFYQGSLPAGGGAAVHRNSNWVGYSVAYRPRFNFLRGL